MAQKRIPIRQIRAHYTDTTLRVYQAYSEIIAIPALETQTFVPPFKTSRMTWIKPSFLWMMYRSAWGTKTGQKRILGIDITRQGFDWALQNSCLAHYDSQIHNSFNTWKHAISCSHVLIQWDPERNLLLDKLPYRTIQIGLSGTAVELYTKKWIVKIEDLTPWAHRIFDLIKCEQHAKATSLLPVEMPYPADARHLGLPNGRFVDSG